MAAEVKCFIVAGLCLDTSVPRSATFQYQFQPSSNWGCGRKFEPSAPPLPLQLSQCLGVTEQLIIF